MASNMPKNITLYGAVDSPFPHRVRITLEEAGLQYDLIWIELLNKPSWYGEKVYPKAKVPFLVYGGPKLQADESPSPDAVTLPESLVILEFLAETFPDAHLLPSDAFLRAKARLFFKHVDEVFAKAWMGFVFFGVTVEDLLAAVESTQALLPSTGFAIGPEWSIADAAFVPFLLRLMACLKNGLGVAQAEGAPEKALEALESPRFARLMGYLHDMMARPSTTCTWDEAVFLAHCRTRVEKLKKTGAFY